MTAPPSEAPTIALGAGPGFVVQLDAFSGPLDEYRLRRALATGRYPVPHALTVDEARATVEDFVASSRASRRLQATP